MKHVLLGTFLFIAVFTASAQKVTPPRIDVGDATSAVKQGNWIVQTSIGSTGYNFTSETYSLSLTPGLAYFLTDRIALGAQLNTCISSSKSSTYYGYSLTPFARYYFPEGATKISRWFGTAALGFAGSYRSIDSKNRFGIETAIGGGYDYFFSKHAALEGQVGYTWNRADLSASATNSGIAASIGILVTLEGKK